MNKRILFILSASLILFALAVLLLPDPWLLTVSTPKDSRVRYRLPVKEGDVFSLRYTHSVTKREVAGTFVVTGDGGIKPLTTIFDAFGPGLPYLDGSLPYVEEGGFYIVFHNEEPRDKISLFVSPLTGERLIVGNRELALAAFQEEPLLIHIYLKKRMNIRGGNGNFGTQ